MSDRGWFGSCALLVVLALLAGLPRMASIPLDSHEIFVAGTARNMHARGDWVLPWFNGKPRLNKPPLNYWAAGAIAAMAGDLPRVEAWHVRLVSVLAGVGLLFSTLGLGATLFDRVTALVAGGLLVGSAGFFSFMHDGRPDMLYAACNGFMLWGIAGSMHAKDAGARRRWCWLLWLAAAAAILTKGPQLPLPILLGVAAWLRWRTGRWAEVLAILRPGFGLVLVAIVCVPWWWAVSARLSTLAVENSQLGGSLLAPSLAHLSEAYYLWRPLQLLLPWLPLIALSGWQLSRMRVDRQGLGILWSPLLAGILVLSLGRQSRYFYLLPLLGPMVLLVARPLAGLLEGRGLRAGVARLFTGLQVVVILGCAVWVISQADGTLLAVGLILIAGLIGAALMARQRHCPSALRVIFPLVVSMTSVWTAAALTGRLWDEERYASHALARRAAEVLGAGVPLATLSVSPTLYAYYGDRVVPEWSSLAELEAWIQSTGQPAVGLVLPNSRLPTVEQRFTTRRLESFRRRDDGESLVVIAVRPP